MEKREYYIACSKCKGTQFSFSQVIDRKPSQTWHDIEVHKTFCHDGFGWALEKLENFDIMCINCQGHAVEVKHKEVK